MNSNDIVARPLPWRRITPLHDQLGARVLKSAIVTSAPNQLVTLFNAPFHADTIDRIIGVEVRIGAATQAGNWTLQDLNSGWSMTVRSGNFLGNYGFNIETLLDSANLVFSCSETILSTWNAQISLKNFEIMPYQLGHS